MSIRIIDFPHSIPEAAYRQALKSMTERVVRTKMAKAVYQVGGISSPGISDLDMVVVFQDNAMVEENLLAGLTKEEQYLFIHNLYGISERKFAEAEQFAFYHQYELLAGVDLRSHSRLPAPDIEELKIQIALEFMVKMHVTLFLQSSYGVLRMRDLLLHVKALQYDLDFLGVTGDKVNRHISQVLEWRNSWFKSLPAERDILAWWKAFYTDFDRLLRDKFASLPFYLPAQTSYSIAKNILLLPSEDRISSSHKGLILPKLLSLIGKKYFRLQNRLNRFQFNIPVKSDHFPDVIEKKFRFEKDIVDYNKKYLPHFLPITSSLHAI
ncbi:MAG: hypothetical protein NTV09_14710 [Bacteroidetes bacterium]|nr:hypothetical protein [Bacteroidota bacterium]